mmetsp:Transcript_117145/g.311548  ORF Transcript_117145/g.311548 Transcript_117145/m.311548 type:complete len:307 (+) Transcript_117145:91-1011(+)
MMPRPPGARDIRGEKAAMRADYSTGGRGPSAMARCQAPPKRGSGTVPRLPQLSAAALPAPRPQAPRADARMRAPAGAAARSLRRGRQLGEAPDGGHEAGQLQQHRVRGAREAHAGAADGRGLGVAEGDEARRADGVRRAAHGDAAHERRGDVEHGRQGAEQRIAQGRADAPGDEDRGNRQLGVALGPDGLRALDAQGRHHGAVQQRQGERRRDVQRRLPRDGTQGGHEQREAARGRARQKHAAEVLGVVEPQARGVVHAHAEPRHRRRQPLEEAVTHSAARVKVGRVGADVARGEVRGHGTDHQGV